MIGECKPCEKMIKRFEDYQKLKSVPMKHGETARVVARLKEMQTALGKTLQT